MCEENWLADRLQLVRLGGLEFYVHRVAFTSGGQITSLFSEVRWFI